MDQIRMDRVRKHIMLWCAVNFSLQFLAIWSYGNIMYQSVPNATALCPLTPRFFPNMNALFSVNRPVLVTNILILFLTFFIGLLQIFNLRRVVSPSTMAHLSVFLLILISLFYLILIVVFLTHGEAVIDVFLISINQYHPYCSNVPYSFSDDVSQIVTYLLCSISSVILLTKIWENVLKFRGICPRYLENRRLVVPRIRRMRLDFAPNAMVQEFGPLVDRTAQNVPTTFLEAAMRARNPLYARVDNIDSIVLETANPRREQPAWHSEALRMYESSPPEYTENENKHESSEAGSDVPLVVSSGSNTAGQEEAAAGATRAT